ncbi:2-hydroxyacid dehydrogenase [Mucilaginibacter paludis]|uniref:D-isomer specific 2-hydroxyacid dehydrogenase NAD-binding n=1 Tax=Mucilaginibacter paludis DSM 18603 TaxID=714943 RepID=H1YCI2_9SPHI|nr:D-glycerate dehydrogenase [Mucilaginibacter paludis]EHQ30660.1 D-isomer specific 2-hydroxyacid dehydrogenase NAD-binding [Mucilaginibacter paludis DSM 18603]
MNVFVTRLLPAEGLTILQAAGCNVRQHEEKRELSKQELIDICQHQDVLLSTGPIKLDADFFKNCSHLKGVALMSVGYDNVDMAAATHYGIPVSNTPDVLSRATADTAFLLILAVSRNAFFMSRSIAKGDWVFYDPTANLGIELYGKTIGIFGMGRIGAELAAKCKAVYQMNVIYHNRKPNVHLESELGARYVSFNELLKQSDVLSVHANLSTETEGLFNHAVFKKMKPSAIFINTARGGIHNEADLTEALKNNVIWGAGLDVTQPEPMQSNNALLSMPRVCVLPHIGSATVETRGKMAVMAAENAIAALQNRRMPQVLNPIIYKQ